MAKKYCCKVFNSDGSLFISAVGSFGTVQNFIEDFSGLNEYYIKVFELREDEESEDK